MVVYNLEEDPNMYISPSHSGNRFMYRMATFTRESLTRKVIRNIDLRNDKLKVYGTEIKEPVLRRLYESLTLGVGPKMGHIYVNCNGACYFFITGKGICRPIYNIIFDWSAFEVVVPDSLNDSLRKQLHQKQIEIEKENEDVKNEHKRLQDELSASKEELICTKKQLLESSEKKVNELIKGYQDNNVGLLQKVSDEIQSVISKVKFANKKLDQALVTQLWANCYRDNDDLPVSIAIEDEVESDNNE